MPSASAASRVDSGHRLDAGAEDLDVERAGKERQRNDRPADVGDNRHLQPAVGRIGRGELAQREVEEQQLDQRRRVAEELDVALHHAAQPSATANPASRRRQRR